MSHASRAEDVVEAWAQRYVLNPSWQDIAHSVVADPDGNVYVTGSDWGAVTLKYSASGALLWAVDAGGAQARLAPDGSIVVSGGDQNVAPWRPNVTKLAPDGTVIWASEERSGLLELDRHGNIYSCSGSYGAVCAKFDPNGTLLWRIPDQGFIAIDAMENVFMTRPVNSDWITTKYDSSGQLLWSGVIDGPAHLDDQPVGIGVDEAGNAYVAGNIATGTWVASDGTVYPRNRIALAKYAPSGELVWLRYPAVERELEHANGLAIGPAGELAVLGSTDTSWGWGFYVLKFDSAGSEIWTQVPEQFGRTYPSAVIVDGDGAIYVTGREANSIATVKYGAAGDLRWTKIRPPEFTFDGLGLGSPLFVDGRKNVYLASYSATGWGPDHIDMLTVKYAADDADGDGFSLQVDCNDANASIHPGATEVKHDGVDQDCNGYDLTIDVLDGTYKLTPESIKIKATSTLGAAAALQVAGYGPMTWDGETQIWTANFAVSGGNPGSVTVLGIEGSVGVTLRLQP